MSSKQENTPGRTNLSPAVLSVKAQILQAGIALAALAAAAKIKQSTLSNYLAGHRQCPARQEVIWYAFRQLTGAEISLADFWGPLWAGA